MQLKIDSHSGNTGTGGGITEAEVDAKINKLRDEILALLALM